MSSISWSKLSKACRNSVIIRIKKSVGRETVTRFSDEWSCAEESYMIFKDSLYFI